MEHLILPTEDAPAKGRLAVALSALLTLAVLVGSPVTDLLDPIPKKRAVGVQQLEQAQLKQDAKLWDGSFMRLLEIELGLRSRSRSWLGPFAAAAQLKLGRIESGKGILAGHDGWLFLENRATLDPVSTAIASAEGAELLRALQARLAQRGIRTVFLVVPRKVAIASSKAPSEAANLLEFDAELAARCDELGVNRVPLLEGMQELGAEQAFLRHDSHWGDASVLLAARLVAENLALEPDAELAVKIEMHKRKEGRDLLHMLGIAWEHPASDWFPAGESDLLHAVVSPESPPPKPRVALVGTSYSTSFFLAHRLTLALGTHAAPLAEPGQMFLKTVADVMLRVPGAERLEALIVEFPGFQLAHLAGPQPHYHKIVGRFVASLPPANTVPLDVPVRTIESAEARGNLTPYTPGELGDARDGTLWVELRVSGPARAKDDGAVPDTPDLWFVESGRLRMQVPIPEGSPVQVPVLGDGRLVVRAVDVAPGRILECHPVRLVD